MSYAITRLLAASRLNVARACISRSQMLCTSRQQRSKTADGCYLHSVSFIVCAVVFVYHNLFEMDDLHKSSILSRCHTQIEAHCFDANKGGSSGGKRH